VIAVNKILITGGAGFIGSHTTDLLLQAGKKVTVFDNLSTGKITNLDLFNPLLEFIPGDVLDYPALLTQVKRCDAILHLAALPSVPESIADPINSLRVNTQGFLHVLQAVRDSGKKIRLVQASSAAVYGSSAPLPCNDAADLPEAPLSPYALEKANNERYAALFARLFGIESVALRYFNVYGPRQDPKSPYSGVISRFIEHYKQQADITVWGDGTQSRDFIYVGDVARANVAALMSDYVGVVNVATGTPETLLKLINCIEQVGGMPAKIAFGAARTGDIRESYAQTNKAQKYLNFSYQTQLADGIQLLMSS
jgi:UDP-glucose 4-epimerase